MADTDKYILTIVQIEHIDVVKDLPEIAKLPGISGFVVGPNDFTMSMNTPERTYTVNDPEVQEQFDKIGQALAGTGKPLRSLRRLQREVRHRLDTPWCQLYVHEL